MMWKWLEFSDFWILLRHQSVATASNASDCVNAKWAYVMSLLKKKQSANLQIGMKWKICRINLLRFDCFYMQHFQSEREIFCLFSCQSRSWQFGQKWLRTQIVGVFYSGKNNHFELAFRARGSILIRFTHASDICHSPTTRFVCSWIRIVCLFSSHDFRFTTQPAWALSHNTVSHWLQRTMCGFQHTFAMGISLKQIRGPFFAAL